MYFLKNWILQVMKTAENWEKILLELHFIPHYTVMYL